MIDLATITEQSAIILNYTPDGGFEASFVNTRYMIEICLADSEHQQWFYFDVEEKAKQIADEHGLNCYVTWVGDDGEKKTDVIN